MDNTAKRIKLNFIAEELRKSKLPFIYDKRNCMIILNGKDLCYDISDYLLTIYDRQDSLITQLRNNIIKSGHTELFENII